MPIELEYISSGNYLHVTVEGVLVLDDFRQAMDKITSSEEFSPDVNTIWNLQKVDTRFSDKELEESLISIRKSANEKRGNAKVAFVVSDDLSFGVSRKYQILSELEGLSQEIEIFKREEDARKWVTE